MISTTQSANKYSMKSLHRAFTLFELLLVIVLVGVLYAFTLSNLNFLSKQETIESSLGSLKKILQGIEYDTSLSIHCINEGKECLVKADGVIQDKKVEGLFESFPEVYSNTKYFDTMEFEAIELEHLESYDVVFALYLDKDGRHKDTIVKTDQKVYLLSSIYEKPLEFEYINEIRDYKEKLKEEILYAF